MGYIIQSIMFVLLFLQVMICFHLSITHPIVNQFDDIPRSSPITDQQYRCSTPPKTGFCKAYLTYWFYNSNNGQCETFIYGGCEAGSTSNHFKTKNDCEVICKNGASFANFQNPTTLFT